MEYAYLGLGSNVGERASQLDEAIRILDNTDGIQVTQKSPIYETEPVGYVDQPQFLNQCIEIYTSLTPQDLLKECLHTEQQLHRVRDIRCNVTFKRTVKNGCGFNVCCIYMVRLEKL